jgi:NhaP-type Na+/H+ and K+/H+ antiporter
MLIGTNPTFKGECLVLNLSKFYLNFIISEILLCSGLYFKVSSFSKKFKSFYNPSFLLNNIGYIILKMFIGIF